VQKKPCCNCYQAINSSQCWHGCKTATLRQAAMRW
jgi:hypothetical protein